MPTSAFEAISAPSDADADAIHDILLYHMLGSQGPGTEIPAQSNSPLHNEWSNGVSLLFDTSAGVAVSGSDVAIADIKCTNGTMHVINDVLLPPNVVDMTLIAGLGGAAATIEDGPSVAAALTTQAPYTVFTPINEALGAIEAPSDAGGLRDVLLLHVVQAAAPVLSAGLPESVKSLVGLDLTFQASEPSVSSPGTAE